MDSKNIKDYLHLYLGCDTDKGKLIGIELNKAVCMMNDLSIVEGNIYSLKPILRPLSDMTEDEAWEFAGGKSESLYDDLKIESIDKTGIQISYAIDAGDEGWHIQRHKFDFYAVGPSQFIWMLSKHFDLFGLIDAGLAIKKSD